MLCYGYGGIESLYWYISWLSNYFYSCVCSIPVYVSICHMCRCMHKPKEDAGGCASLCTCRGQRGTLCHPLYCILLCSLETGSFPETWTHSQLRGWPISPSNSISTFPTVLRLKVCLAMPGFLLGAWDLKSGPHVFTAVVLTQRATSLGHNHSMSNHLIFIWSIVKRILASFLSRLSVDIHSHFMPCQWSQYRPL